MNTYLERNTAGGAHKRLEHIAAAIAYRTLYRYCRRHLRTGTCSQCIFAESKPKRCCIYLAPPRKR